MASKDHASGAGMTLYKEDSLKTEALCNGIPLCSLDRQRTTH